MMPKPPAWHAHAATMMDDPIILDWALDYYDDQVFGGRHGELDVQWFHTANLARWFTDIRDDVSAADVADAQGWLIRTLPAAAFGRFFETLAKRWRTWPLDTAREVTAVVAALNPTRAAEIFSAYLDEPPPLEFERISAITDNLGKLPDSVADALMAKLISASYLRGESSFQALRCSLFEICVYFNRTADLPALLDQAFTPSQPNLNLEMDFTAAAFFGHFSYSRVYFLRRANKHATSFASLSPLFETDAPLAEMDAVAAAKRPLPLALALLESHYKRLPEAEMVWNLIPRCQAINKPRTAAVLAGLVIAAVAAVFERRAIDVDGMSDDDALALLALDIETNVHYEALLDVVRAAPRGDISAKAIAQLQHCRQADSDSGSAILRMMGDLGYSEFLPSLIAAIDDVDGGAYSSYAAVGAMRVIGAPARDALIGCWDKLNESQQDIGGHLIRRIGGEPVADFVLSRRDASLGFDTREWCDFVMTSPDPRVAELVRSKLSEDDPEINEAGYRLLRLFADSDPALPGLREKILRRRANEQRQRIGASGTADLPALELACVTCKASNFHDVGEVMCDPECTQAPYLIVGEFPCKTCGTRIGYELSANAKRMLLAETVQLMGLDNPGDRTPAVPPTRISKRTVKDKNGVVQSINAAYIQQQVRVQIDPQDWSSWHRLANIEFALQRPHAALYCAQRAYELNPHLLEIVYNVAARLKEVDRAGEALTLLEEALKHAHQWTTHSSAIAQEGIDFAALYNGLRHHTGRTHIPALHPQFVAGLANLSSQKQNRNDPCACGSGKKFKKCCMR